MDYRSSNMVTPYTELHPGTCALLVVDTQNDYAHPRGSNPVPGAAEVVPVIAACLDVFRRAGNPVIHVVRLYMPDGSNVDPCRRWQFERGERRAVVAGTWGSQLAAATSPGGELDADLLLSGSFQELAYNEYAMYKPRFGAFTRTPLHSFFQERGVDSVVIVGITFPNCVLATQIGATDLDYRVGLVPEACTEVNEEGLRSMQNKGVQILTLQDIRDLMSH